MARFPSGLALFFNLDCGGGAGGEEEEEVIESETLFF
jgi:hypothetical protein